MTRRTFLASVFVQSTPRLGGTFLQLNAGHLDWPESRWTELFGYFHSLRLSRLILQWTKDEDVSFVPLLPMLLQHAARNGMKVHIGLFNSKMFWSATGPAMTVMFAQLHEQIIPLIDELKPFVQRPAFAGWYISQEFDDERWTRKTMRQNGGTFLRSVIRSLRQQTPHSEVAVSAFANGKLSPEELALLWWDVIRYSKLNELLFQDGIGVHKLTLEQLPLYLHALRNQLGKQLTHVVEIFEQTADDPFAAIPASLDRIEQQLAVSSHSAIRSIAFSVPEYMTPLGGDAARRLFEQLTQATIGR